MQPQYGQQPPMQQAPAQQPFIMNIQQNAGPQGYAPAPPAPAYGGYPTQQQAAPAPAPVVIQQNKQGKSFGLICCFLIVVAFLAIIIAAVNSDPGFAVKDICELDGQTFALTENIILTEPQVNSQSYEDNKNCQVTITVPDKQISLQFEHFEVESYSLGCHDWLKVEDETYCGSASDAYLEHDPGFDEYQEYSTGMQSLTFQWFTDSMFDDKGFRVILKHKDEQNKPDFFDNSVGFRSHLTLKQKEE